MRAVSFLLAWLLVLPAHAEVVLDEAAVRAAIDRELQGLDHGGKMAVSLPGDGTATLSYTRRDGRSLSRTITLPARAEDAIETLALLADNLVRDQLADLGPAPPVVVTAPAAPPRRIAASIGLFPPVTTDSIFHRGRALHHFSLQAVVGVARATHGVSIAGAVDVTTDVRGVQLSGAVNVAGEVRGLQIAGAVNVADRVDGLQLAPINVAKRSRGLQLGVVNYSESEDGIAIGVLSIVRNGLTEGEVAFDSTLTTQLFLRHGRRHFYNLYGVGVAVASDGGALAMAGLGLGGRVWRAGRVDVDVAAMTWGLEGDGVVSDLTLLNQARLTVAVGLGRFALLAGANLNVFIADNDEDGAALHPVLDTSWKSGETTVRMWPSFALGLRLR